MHEDNIVFQINFKNHLNGWRDDPLSLRSILLIDQIGFEWDSQWKFYEVWAFSDSFINNYYLLLLWSKAIEKWIFNASKFL